jgi:hypothetical protein
LPPPPPRTAFRPLRCCMALRGAGGTQEGSGSTSGGAFLKKKRKEEAGLKKKRGNTTTPLIPRTTLTTPLRAFSSALEGLLRPEVLASIGLIRAGGSRANAVCCLLVSEAEAPGPRVRHCFTYLGPPNGPIQRPKPVRYVQYECYETTARSETRKLARVRPARCPAWGIWP